MFQPKSSTSFMGAGLAILLLISLGIAANWGVLPLGLLSAALSGRSVASSTMPAPAATATVGAGGSYSTLKAAFDDINSGANGLTGAVELQIVGDTTETASAVLNSSGTGGSSYTSVLIHPTGGARTISGSIAAGSPLIDLNGADNVTIDGVNAGGASLTISNDTVSALAGTSTVRFVGGADNNTLTNLTLLGSFAGSATVEGGTVFFSTDAVTGRGNDRNAVSNSDIGPAGTNLPTKAIYSKGSAGTAAANNSSITLDNNNVHDYFGAAVSSAGVYLDSGTTDCVVSNSRFYQTDIRTQTTGSQHSAIWVDNSAGNNFRLIGNTIGFASSAGTGSYAVVTAATGSSVVPVFLNVGTSVVTSVQANTIAGFEVSGAASGSGNSAPFRGIFVPGGLTTIGDAAGNTIGSQTANDSIVYTSSSAADSEVAAISNFGSSDWVTNNNLIGGITASSSGSAAAIIYGIRAEMPPTSVWTARNNTIGGSVANSIRSTSTAAGTRVQGFLTYSPIAHLSFNIIRSLTAGGGTGIHSVTSVAGIVVEAPGPDHDIAGNSISDLSNTSTTAATVVTGIAFSSGIGNNTVERNLIARLTSSTNSAGAQINGIGMVDGSATFRNNMILLGAGVTNSLGSAAAGISGISDRSGSNNYLHNSVYVGGSSSAGAGNSYAFNSSTTNLPRVFRNNIFVNARSNSGTASGKNYAVHIAGTAANPTGLTINNNIYFVNGTGTVFGTFNGSDVADLAAWKTAVGQDAASIAGDPLFVSATDLHLLAGSPARDAGATGLGVSDDIDGKSRPGANASFDIGADEFDGNAPPVNDMQATAFVDPASGATIIGSSAFYPSASFTNNGSASQTNVTVRYRICSDANCDTVVYNQTAVISSIASQASGTYAFPAASISSPGTYTIRARPELAGDTVAANDEITGTLVIEAPLAGTYSIGSGGNYATLTDAINKLTSNGVTGPVTLNLTDAAYDTAETFPIVIGPISGASSANQITIKPASGASPVITGSSSSCVLTLAGADHVTLDGSNNGTASRDLTIENSNAGTNSAVLCLQNAPGPDSATNDVIKNVNIKGSGNAQTLFGIFSGGPGTPSLTNLGSGNSLNSFDNNKIEKAQYGIYSQGAAANAKNNGNSFTRNDLNSASPDNLGKGGILLGFENNAVVSGNRIDGIVQASSSDVFGIALGLTDLSTTSFAGNDVTNASVTGNLIGTVKNTGNSSAVGIALAFATSGTNLIANNAIYGVGSNGTVSKIGAGILTGGGAGSTTKIYYNSVSLTGTLTGGTSPVYGLAIGGSDPTVDVQNNAFYNTSANGTGESFAIGTASSTFANLTSDHNDLFVAAGSGFKVGKTGSLSAGSGTAHKLLSDWTTATGKDTPNSLSADPQFIAADDLRPQTGSPLIGAGSPVPGTTTDITGATRSATAPSIGAYESGVDTRGPTIQYTPLGNTASTADRTLTINVTDTSGVPTSGAGLPKIYYRKGISGPYAASTQCSFVSGGDYACTIDYSLVSGGPAVGDTVEYFVAAQDSAGNVSVNPSAGAGGFTTNPPAASTPPTTPSSYAIVASVSGALSVGSGQTFTSLTRNDAGGLFRYLNANVVAGDLTISITSDLTNENGAVALNAFASPYTLKIVPTGGARVISGTSTGAAALIKLNGADRVTINGSVDGLGTDRSLSISDANANGAVVWIASASATDPATDNTIENCVISGSGPAGTVAGLLSGSGAILGDPAAAANDNNTFRGNVVTGAQNGVYVNGKPTGGDSNWLIIGNTFGSSTAADKLGFRGVFVSNSSQAKVQQNTIAGVASSVSSTATVSGVMFSGLVAGGEISRNQISDIKQMNPAGGGSNGILLAASSAAANLKVSNNFINNVASQGTAGVTAGDNGYGLMISSGGGYLIYNNSISMDADQASASSVTAAVNVAAGVTGVGALDLRNNALSNTETVGTRYAIYVASPAGNTIFSNIDGNDYFAQNVGFLGSAKATLSAWQAATGKDAASISADPKFTSNTDLHLLESSPLIDAGLTIAAVTDDIDGDSRPALTGYDIGADEFLDRLPPDTTIDSKPSDPSNSSTATFTFSGTDTGHSGVASFECKLDGGQFSACSSPKSYPNLADGPHTFQVRAKDAAGNTDPSPASYGWTIDTQAPDTQILTKPANPTNSTTATFTFSGADTIVGNTVTFECKLDAGTFAQCSSPQDYTGLAEGEHTFQVRAVDLAQNSDQSPASYTWTIDTQPPDTQILTKPTNPSNSSTATFTFSGADTVVGNTVTFECKLDTDAFAACTSPRAYTGLADGEHTFQVRAVDPVQNSDPSPASYTWTIDTQPPDTQILTQPSNPSNSATASFTFSGADTIPANTVTFECKLDTGAFAACTSPRVYTGLADGEHTFQVRAVDPAQNSDASPASYTWTVDTQAPDTQILTKPTNPSNSATATFTFSGADTVAANAVTFECKLDTAAFAACSSPQLYTGLADGEHTFEVRAVDPAQNSDTSPASYTWTVDTQAPDTQILTQPANPSNSATATFTFSGSDTVVANAVTFECKLDTGAFATCTSPRLYTGLADGEHTFQVRAVDPAQNSDASPASYTWTVDTQAPDTQILTQPANPSNSANATFTFSGADTIAGNVVTFECKIDADAFAACTTPKTYTGLSQGSHTVQVRAVDAARNQDASPASYTWTLDAIAPDTQILTMPPNPSNTSDATFTFAGTDSLVEEGSASGVSVGLTFECSLDSAVFASCSSPANYTDLAEGSHTLQVRAIDFVGNVDQTPATYTWNIVFPVSVTATSGILGPTKYLTLKAAFTAVNLGVHQGDVNINLVGNTIEHTPATLYQSGIGNSLYNYVHLQPSGGAARSITGNIAGPLIDLDGADSVTVNGLNSGGNSLTISNTSGDPSASTIRLINDACVNSFLNTRILGSTGADSNTGLGVIYLGQGVSTGNDSNTFNGNTITAAGTARPINGIYSVGTGVDVENNGNTISGNLISDYFNPNAAASGINLGANNSGGVISSNRLFQTGSRTFQTAAVQTAINIASGSGYSLFGNTIGYSAADSTGTYVIDGTVGTRFVGINVAVSTAASTFVQNNTIASVSLATTSGVSTGSGVLCGINVVSGNVTLSNNTLGSLSSADSLVAVSTASQPAVVGINSSSTGTLSITNNRFGGLTSANASAPTIGGIVYGINISAAAASMAITGNTIGNVVGDNMRAGVGGTTTADTAAVGINAAPATPATASYSNNIIRNLSSYGTGSAGYVRGIQTGTTPSSSPTATINGNTISNLTTASALQGVLSANAAAVGIELVPGSNVSITGNKISNISDINSSPVGTIVAGITHGSASNSVIANNQIWGLTNASTSTIDTNPPVIAGIVIRSGAVAINVQNNMVSLGSNQTGNAAIVGIWANHGGTPDPVDKIYFNSVNIEGTGATGSFPSMAFLRGDFQISRTQTVDIRNNIFNNTRSGGTGKHYAIANNYGVSSGSSSTGWPALASNYNVLNANPATVGFWTTDTSFAGWKAASSSDGSSFSGITLNFVDSSSNLHINAGLTPSALESGGTPIAGLTTDIDGQTRPGPVGSVNGAAFAPDLGADEFDGVFLDAIPPTISYTELTNVTTTSDRTLAINVADATGVAAGANSPRIYYKRSTDAGFVSTGCLYIGGTAQNGTYNCTISYGLLPGGSVSRGDSIQYFVVAQDTTGNVSADPNVGFTAINVNNVTNPPTTPASYLISSSYSGNFTVGSGGTYTSLTNPGGIFEALNNGVVSGNLSIKIVSDLTNETGAVSLNQLAEEGVGGYTVTISPSGANRTISGSSDSWIIRIADADRIIIDGSLTGGTANAIGGDQTLRNLTIQNTSVTATGGTVVAISAVSNTVQNVTIRNVNISGQDPTQTQVGLHIGGPTAGSDGGPNNNIRVENCSFQKSLIGIYDGGLSPASPGVGHVLTMNDLSATGVLRLRRAGMMIFNQDGIQINRNSVGGIVNDEAADTYGIGLGLQRFDSTYVTNGGITNAVVTRNRVSGVVNINSSGFSAVGLGIAGGTTGANTVSNNMISGVSAANTQPDLTAGIFIAGVTGSNTKLYFNSVSMTGDRGSNASQVGSYALAVTGTNPTVELKDNIFFTNQTSGGGTKAKSYSIGLASTTFTNLNSNYNDFLSAGSNAAGFRTGGLGGTATDIATLAGWRSATGKDANSIEVDPIYMDPLTNLHLFSSSQVLKAGTAVSGITIDFDGDTRPANPDMGADQVDQTAPDTQILTGPPTSTTSTSATFTFSGTDSLVQVVATFQCQLDGGSFNPCSSPTGFTNLTPGGHTFQVRAIDAAGNADPSPASYSWTIDLNSPDTQILTSPPNPDNNTSPSFTFSGTDSLANSVASFECKLDAGSFTACSSPQPYTGLAAGQHTFQVRAIDAAGNVDQTPAAYTWVIDSNAPDTQILTHPADPSPSSSAAFTFSGTDSAVESVASYECKLDGASFAPCNSGDSYNGLADGSHTFQVRARDNAGNVDPTPASFAWTVDTTAPDTQILTKPVDPSGSTSAAFTFSGTDSAVESVAGFECKLDTGSFTSCTSPQPYNGLADGQHTFQVRARDLAGNFDQTPAAFTWVVDTLPPDTQILTKPSDPTSSTSATFTFSGTDSAVESAVSFECKLDAGAFTGCSSPQSYSSLVDGQHTFQVRAKDAAGNVDQTPAAFTWTVDTIPPDTQVLTKPADPSSSSSAVFTFSGSDSAVEANLSFECKWDGAAFESCVSPSSKNNLTDGSHTFQVRAIDQAGNVDQSAASYTWVIDTTGPDTQILTKPADQSPSSSATFTFSGSDSIVATVASFECKLDAGSFTLCSSPKPYSGLAEGLHTFQVRAKDTAGNVDGTPASYSWTVDTIAPDTQILTHPADQSTSASAQFTFSGSDSAVESVFGFECKLDSAAFETCSSPRDYTGLADGNHTFQVRAKDAAGNVDGSPASFAWTVTTGLTGTFNVGANGDFTSLTNPGGLFDRLNTMGLSGNVVANITSDLTAETGAIALNQLAGGFLTIKPSGGPRTISGNGTALGLIRLAGADNVTIDGSLSGGTDRSLTITYGNPAGAVIWIGSAGSTNGAVGNTVKNCVISGSAGTTIVGGVVAGSGATLGGQADAANSFNTIRNNAIYRVQNSVYINGANTLDQNWNIVGNRFGSATASDMNELRGILISNVQNFTINGNVISGVHSTASTTAAVHGIQLTGVASSGFVVNNTISDIHNLSGSGAGAFGIRLSSTSAAANVTVANNFVSDVSAIGSATLTSNGFGIVIDGVGAGGYGIFHNSVNLNTNQSTGVTAAILVASSVTAAGTLDIRNNIFANSQNAGAARYAIYSGAAPNVYSTLGYNDYFAPTIGFISGADRVVLDDWQAASGQDSHSKAVDPRFVSAIDLHLRNGSPMVDAAVLISSVTSDIDGQSRPVGSANDIGADEMTALVTISGRVVGSNGLGISGAVISMAGSGQGSRRTALTNPFGNYFFDNVATGQSYTISVKSRLHTYDPSFNVATPYTDFSMPDFIGIPQ